ncbi:DUF1330 domain-containing protein [Streptomyces sp. NBC_01210]|uniref:DUF1330 domain-containing protein n=1 Tax=Streptomyces sp. NBC_01210 TaxID=2903774 RepID=UPI002E10997A|nr:DUF1330 domain-containing protein [Streptomyces sp. NBC_01210]
MVGRDLGGEVAHTQEPPTVAARAAKVPLDASTLDPFGGRFLVHGATVELREGEWPGALVIIGFAGMAEARRWYDSEAYQELLPLRTRHMAGDVILVEGVAPGYDAAVTAARLREAQAMAP